MQIVVGRASRLTGRLKASRKKTSGEFQRLLIARWGGWRLSSKTAKQPGQFQPGSIPITPLPGNHPQRGIEKIIAIGGDLPTGVPHAQKLEHSTSRIGKYGHGQIEPLGDAQILRGSIGGEHNQPCAGGGNAALLSLQLNEMPQAGVSPIPPIEINERIPGGWLNALHASVLIGKLERLHRGMRLLACRNPHGCQAHNTDNSQQTQLGC